MSGRFENPGRREKRQGRGDGNKNVVIYARVMNEKGVDKSVLLCLTVKKEKHKNVEGIMSLPERFREPVVGVNRYGTEWAVCLLS